MTHSTSGYWDPNSGFAEAFQDVVLGDKSLASDFVSFLVEQEAEAASSATESSGMSEHTDSDSSGESAAEEPAAEVTPPEDSDNERRRLLLVLPTLTDLSKFRCTICWCG